MRVQSADVAFSLKKNDADDEKLIELNSTTFKVDVFGEWAERCTAQCVDLLSATVCIPYRPLVTFEYFSSLWPFF